MNAWLDEARRLDPVGAFSLYIRKLNNLFDKRRTEFTAPSRWSVPKAVAEILDQSIEDGRHLRVFKHTSTIFEVRRTNDPEFFRTVDLQQCTCTCGFFLEKWAFRAGISARCFSS